ncbi:MAG: gas vesicle protein GvpN [Candidatus Electryoneaceae bacterium]|nr:gas vesicle protein GvpN [Candidatus Electryoneaceae bacterium]
MQNQDSAKTGTLKAVQATLSRISPNNDSVAPEASERFVSTPAIQELTDRVMSYIEVGYPIHFAGPAGTGKTTLAFHVAAQRGRTAILIHGDDEFKASDLIGSDVGYKKTKLIDNYIHSVRRTEEAMNSVWVDNRLTTACQNGYTLIYDEFTRPRPEANNVLLSVLQERILNMPKLGRSGEGYLDVHPDFRVIFTSNPEEYAGTHKTQDALMDRLITIQLGQFDRETEVQITMAKSGIAREDADIIVSIVRELRETGVNNHQPSLRACIAIARILYYRKGTASMTDPYFLRTCCDVLKTNTLKVTKEGISVMPQKVEEVVANICGGAHIGREC